MRALRTALCVFLAANVSAAVKPKKAVPTSASVEKQRQATLEKTLCAYKDLSCDYIRGLFNDPRFRLYAPPPPASPPPSPVAREYQRNPYLTVRFGLLTPESLERCRTFINQYGSIFDAAMEAYGVPKEVICGHLRIETNFGLATPLTPHPLGSAPAFSRLVTLYVRQSTRSRQQFAVTQLKDLITAAVTNGWDLFSVPGSSTGAIGLLQFEPFNFSIAVDGDGDGKIDLFNPADAIMSLAHFLEMHGYDKDPEHQHRAIYSYYGRDPNSYYVKAVLAYAQAESSYLKTHPVVLTPPAVSAPVLPLPLQLDQPEPAPPEG